MVRRKYKMTGFSRLLIFLIIFMPIAYVGSSYYNGENGIQKIQDLLGINQTEKETIKTKNSDCEYLLTQKDLEIAKLKKRLANLSE